MNAVQIDRAVRFAFSAWEVLAAWGVRGRRFDRRVKLVVHHAGTDDSHGWTNADHRDGWWKITVRAGTDLADSLTTLLHEMAHVVTWREKRHHSSAWARVYAEAAAEVAGGSDPRWAAEIPAANVLDVQVCEVIRAAGLDHTHGSQVGWVTRAPAVLWRVAS